MRKIKGADKKKSMHLTIMLHFFQNLKLKIKDYGLMNDKLGPFSSINPHNSFNFGASNSTFIWKYTNTLQHPSIASNCKFHFHANCCLKIFLEVTRQIFNPLNAKHANLYVSEIRYAYVEILRFPKWYDTWDRTGGSKVTEP